MDVSSHSNYFGLLFSAKILSFKVSSNLFGGGDPVHNGHLDICQNYGVFKAQFVHHFHLIDGFLASDTKVTLVLHVGTNFEQNSFH